MAARPRKILFVYEHRDQGEMRASISSHLRALEASDIPHEITYYNAAEDINTWDLDNAALPMPKRLRGNSFDAVLLHTTLLCMRWTGAYFPKWKKKFDWIGEMECPKIAIPQDEYDHNLVLNEWLLDWGVSGVLSTFDEGPRKLLHPLLYDKARFYFCLTGYIDTRAARQFDAHVIPLAERKNDVVYRARHLPYWFGKLGRQKPELADATKARASALGLAEDVSTRAEDAIVGDRWLHFLGSSRMVVGSESGSSVIDWRGELKEQIQAILKENPGLSYARVSARLPRGWDQYHLAAISPRHFEAVITRTCQILIEGDYNGVLQADRHYIPIKEDFSNLDEALLKVRDRKYLEAMVERSYEEIYRSGQHDYRAFARILEQAIEDGIAGKAKAPAASPVMTLRAAGAGSKPEQVMARMQESVADVQTSLHEVRQSLQQLQQAMQQNRVVPFSRVMNRVRTVVKSRPKLAMTMAAVIVALFLFNMVEVALAMLLVGR